MLYELLTGRKPYRLRSRKAEDISRAITDQEPQRPSISSRRTDRFLTRDLDNIVLTAMRKEPPRPYASAAMLA